MVTGTCLRFWNRHGWQVRNMESIMGIFASRLADLEIDYHLEDAKRSTFYMSAK